MNESGEFETGWLQLDSGIVGEDGIARTYLPPATIEESSPLRASLTGDISPFQSSGVQVSGPVLVGEATGQVQTIGAEIRVTVPIGGVAGTLNFASVGGGAAVGALFALGFSPTLTISINNSRMVTAVLPEEPLPPVTNVQTIEADPGKVIRVSSTVNNARLLVCNPLTRRLLRRQHSPLIRLMAQW